MIFEHTSIFTRYIDCYNCCGSHRFNKDAQRDLFFIGLSRGAALVSPDELSYFRSGCELDSKEEHNIYHGLSGFVTSAALLTEHRLFGTYHGLNFIKEASLQIAVSALYVVHELLNVLLSIIKLGLSLLAMVFTAGLSSTARNWVVSTALSTLSHIVKTCASIVLLVTGIIGALVTRPISTLLNPELTLLRPVLNTKQVEISMKEIGCDNKERVRSSIFWLSNGSRAKGGAGSKLERVVGSLSDIVDEAKGLSSTSIPYSCNGSYY